MKKLKLTLLFCVGLAVLNLFTSCATFSQSKLEQGQYFAFIKNYQEFYNASIPIEEYCYIVNIASDTSISRIDGKSSDVRLGQIVILTPGRHDFNFSFYRQSSRQTVDTAYVTVTTTTRTNQESQTRTLKAGHYYFMEWLTWTQPPIIGDLQEFTSLKISVNDNGETLGSNVPVSSIIEGMNTAIKRVFPNFTPRFNK